MGFFKSLTKSIKKAQKDAEKAARERQKLEAKSSNPEQKTRKIPDFVSLFIETAYDGDDLVIDGFAGAKVIDGDIVQRIEGNGAPEAVEGLIDFIDGMPLVMHESEDQLQAIRHYAINYYPAVFDLLEDPFDVFDMLKVAENVGLPYAEPEEKAIALAAVFKSIGRMTPNIRTGHASYYSSEKAKIIAADTIEQKEKDRASQSVFTEPEKPYVNALQAISHAFISKSGDYIVVRGYNHEIMRIKIGKRLQYILAPQDWVYDQEIYNKLEIGDISSADMDLGDYERVMITGAETLGIFDGYIRNAAEYYRQIFELTPVVWKKKQ